MPLSTRINFLKIVLLLLTLCLGAVQGYNVDVDGAQVFVGPAGSKFGFSVARHREDGETWGIVGAPEMQTSQPGVIRGGAVFRCPLDHEGRCETISFDPTGDRKSKVLGETVVHDQKSRQWLGATVASGGENGVVVACAPLYVSFGLSNKRRNPVGTCWIARRAFSQVEEYSPCRHGGWSYHTKGSCQAGFSVAVTPTSHRMFTGAVGSWFWQGQIYSKNLEFPEDDFETTQGPESDDGSYFGYSLAVGEFSGDEDEDAVVGIPRGNDLKGKVAIFNSGMVNLVNASGEQVGSYYGYAVAAVDLNGDGLDDLVVGAPLFTGGESMGSVYEEGRVYVLYQNSEHQLVQSVAIDGKTSKGRFGLSLTSLGDINQDGYKDLAVGAPYSGDEGRGAVFIYLGGSKGIGHRHSQMITPEQMQNFNIKSFGFSLSPGSGMAKYPGILVGAYESDIVFSFQSRPVITATPSFFVEPEAISLDDRSCILPDGSQASCIFMKHCLEYEGIKYANQVVMKHAIKLDTLKTESRAFFKDFPAKREQIFTTTQDKNKKQCLIFHVYISNDVLDKISPIKVQATHYLDGPGSASKTPNPILDIETNTTISKELHIQKDCGPDNICIPNLALMLNASNKEWIFGETGKMELDVEIVNEGDNAYESFFYLEFPQDVNYINVKNSESAPIICSSSQSETENNLLECKIGNPFPSGETLKFKVLLSPSSNLTSSLKSIDIFARVESRNIEHENTIDDNEVNLKIPVKIEIGLYLRGVSQPMAIQLNMTRSGKDTIDPNIEHPIVHRYEIGNKGKITFTEIFVQIQWPSEDPDGKTLMQLLKVGLSSKIVCQENSHINASNIIRETNIESNNIFLSKINDYNKFGDNDVFSVSLPNNTHANNNINFSQEDLNCQQIKCPSLICKVNDLQPDQIALISMYSVLNASSLDDRKQETIALSSSLYAKVTKVPYEVTTDHGASGLIVTTTLNLEEVELLFGFGISMWWILAACITGFIITFTLVMFLTKCGFFKRTKHPFAEVKGNQSSENKKLYSEIEMTHSLILS